MVGFNATEKKRNLEMFRVLEGSTKSVYFQIWKRKEIPIPKTSSFQFLDFRFLEIAPVESLCEHPLEVFLRGANSEIEL